jgi:hypothetical protein
MEEINELLEIIKKDDKISKDDILDLIQIMFASKDNIQSLQDFLREWGYDE